MSQQEPVEISCPYCGETIEILVDTSAGAQAYIEDCQVCCRPIELVVTLDEDEIPQVEVRRDDE
jgi:Cysteine-rich CPXCG